MSCSVQRNIRSEREVSSIQVRESRDTVRELVLLAVHDTLREVTTVTVQLGVAGDTLRVAQVTERDRLRDRTAVRDHREKLEVRVDTVYIERRDTSYVEKVSAGSEDKTTWDGRLRRTLKWVFWILLAAVVLVVLLRLGRLLKC